MEGLEKLSFPQSSNSGAKVACAQPSSASIGVPTHTAAQCNYSTPATIAGPYSTAACPVRSWKREPRPGAAA